MIRLLLVLLLLALPRASVAQYNENNSDLSSNSDMQYIEESHDRENDNESVSMKTSGDWNDESDNTIALRIHVTNTHPAMMAWATIGVRYNHANYEQEWKAITANSWETWEVTIPTNKYVEIGICGSGYNFLPTDILVSKKNLYLSSEHRDIEQFIFLSDWAEGSDNANVPCEASFRLK